MSCEENNSEMNVLNECRVCFETTDQNIMVSPCHCRGSMAFIHLQCFKNCIEISGEEKCDICGQNWIGIAIVKKGKGFKEFLEEESLNLNFGLIMFTMFSTILTQFIFDKFIFYRKYWLFYTLYSLNLMTFILCNLLLYKIISDFLVWRKFNFKYIVIKCKTINNFDE